MLTFSKKKKKIDFLFNIWNNAERTISNICQQEHLPKADLSIFPSDKAKMLSVLL